MKLAIERRLSGLRSFGRQAQSLVAAKLERLSARVLNRIAIAVIRFSLRRRGRPMPPLEPRSDPSAQAQLLRQWRRYSRRRSSLEQPGVPRSPSPESAPAPPPSPDAPVWQLACFRLSLGFDSRCQVVGRCLRADFEALRCPKRPLERGWYKRSLIP